MAARKKASPKAPEAVSLPARNGTCKTCDGRIHHYPPPPGYESGGWAHLDTGDWIDNPHIAEPKEAP